MHTPSTKPPPNPHKTQKASPYYSFLLFSPFYSPHPNLNLIRNTIEMTNVFTDFSTPQKANHTHSLTNSIIEILNNKNIYII